jgi:hypothetical protein
MLIRIDLKRSLLISHQETIFAENIISKISPGSRFSEKHKLETSVSAYGDQGSIFENLFSYFNLHKQIISERHVLTSKHYGDTLKCRLLEVLHERLLGASEWAKELLQ